MTSCKILTEICSSLSSIFFLELFQSSVNLSEVKLFLFGMERHSVVGNVFPDGYDPEYKLSRDLDLSLIFCSCCCFGLAGRYSMALMAWSLFSVLAGLGKAMEVGGTSLSTVALGRDSLVVWGKIGLPGSGCGARLVLRGATLVLMT